MDLPILKTVEKPSVETLIRYYYQAEANWTAHLAESEELDFGTAWTNPQFKTDVGANCMLNTSLPEGLSPADATSACDAYFAEKGVRCSRWVMNPSAPETQTSPIVAHLLANGYRREVIDVLYLHRLSGALRPNTDSGLTIIPARASFRHARELYESQTPGIAELVEASMLHLDDPHHDALLALRDGRAVGHVGVLSVGEIGLIKQLFVVESERRQGIGSVMLGRAMEICARSLFKHVFVGVVPPNNVALSMYQSVGFAKIGQCVEYRLVR